MKHVLLSKTVVAAADLSRLDSVGNELLDMGQKIGYWVVVIVAVFQIIKASASGDKHKIGEIIMMAVIVYGALFVVPYALTLVSDIF